MIQVIEIADFKQIFRAHCSCGAQLEYRRGDWAQNLGPPYVDCPDCGRIVWHSDSYAVPSLIKKAKRHG